MNFGYHCSKPLNSATWVWLLLLGFLASIDLASTAGAETAIPPSKVSAQPPPKTVPQTVVETYPGPLSQWLAESPDCQKTRQTIETTGFHHTLATFRYITLIIAPDTSQSEPLQPMMSRVLTEPVESSKLLTPTSPVSVKHPSKTPEPMTQKTYHALSGFALTLQCQHVQSKALQTQATGLCRLNQVPVSRIINTQTGTILVLSSAEGFNP